MTRVMWLTQEGAFAAAPRIRRKRLFTADVQPRSARGGGGLSPRPHEHTQIQLLTEQFTLMRYINTAFFTLIINLIGSSGRRDRDVHVCASTCPAISVYLCSLPLRFKERLLRVVFRLSSDEQSSGCFSGLFPLSDLSDLFLCDPVGSTVSSGGAESWPPVFEATEAGDEASLIFTTSNLHHMDSPNGARRLANAISFLINRINSAMLNHNGGHKDSRCAPKTFITIIFISWSKRQRQQWGGGCFRGSSHSHLN